MRAKACEGGFSSLCLHASWLCSLQTVKRSASPQPSENAETQSGPFSCGQDGGVGSHALGHQTRTRTWEPGTRAGVTLRPSYYQTGWGRLHSPGPPCPLRKERGICGSLVFSFPGFKRLKHCYFPVTLLAGILALGLGWSGLEPLRSSGWSPGVPRVGRGAWAETAGSRCGARNPLRHVLLFASSHLLPPSGGTLYTLGLMCGL